MPKALALIVIGAAIAVAAGLAIPSSAVKVNAASISSTQFNDELVAIDHSASYECYLEASAFVRSRGTESAPALQGASSNVWASAASVNWIGIRTSQVASVQFVMAHDPAAFSATSLAAAEVALEQQINATISQAFAISTQVAAFSCPAATSGAKTLASLPTSFVNEQVTAQAAALGLQTLVPNQAPESGPALEAWFNDHQDQFQTTCVRVVVLPDLSTADTVANAIDSGLSLAEAARQYSIDPSKKKAGAIGCFSPTSAGFATVAADVGRLGIGKVALFPATSGQQYPYLLGPSKRTPTHLAYARIASVVAQVAQGDNRQALDALNSQVQQSAGVYIDPAIGTWLPTFTSAAILPPPAPPTSTVTNPAANLAPAPTR